MWTTWRMKAGVNGKFEIEWNGGQWPSEARRALSQRARLERRMRAWSREEADRLLKMLTSRIEESSGMTIDETDEKCWESYTKAYAEMLTGDREAARAIWFELEDWSRLRFTLHSWDLVRRASISPSTWADLLRYTWQRGKTGALLMRAHVAPQLLEEMFQTAPSAQLMNEDGEHAKFTSLPEYVSVWRGTNTMARHRMKGISWTLSRHWAEWFAYRNTYAHGKPEVLQGVVQRSAIMAYFGEEEEVVINPRRRVAVLAKVALPHDDADDTRMKAARDAILATAA